MTDPATTAELVDAFLTRFTTASDAGDTDALAGCFADIFLAGDANRIQPVPRDAFLAAVPGRRQAFAKAGVGAASLRERHLTELDDHHLLVRTTWMAPRLSGEGSVELSSSFLLRRDGDTLTVCLYLNHKGL